MQFSYLNYSKQRVFDFICLWLLPVGLLLLLSDLYFLPGRSLHHKLYYGLFSIPTLIAIILRPRELKEILRDPIVLGFMLFAAWAMASLMWTNGEEDFLGSLKPALHLLMLFWGCTLLTRYRSESLQPVFFAAAIIALVATVYNLYMFISHFAPQDRMVGAGAFDNPLLSSHAFGFFCIYWLTLGMTCKRPQILFIAIPAFTIMFAALLATGSRTPLVAVVMAMVWLSFICWNRRSLALMSMLIAGGVVVIALFSEMIMSRGSSFRFELWQLVLEQIKLMPWIGHGYESTLSLDPGAGLLLSEPHNFALGVLYYTGILGFTPWLFMQVWGLYSSWRHRVQPLFILASAWLVYGIGAGLTEGGGILPRPKEHWYLLWIPLALIAALSINQRFKTLRDRPVRSLSRAALDTLQAHAHVIEEDGLGPKVLRLENGNFLKLFRGRRCYTSGSFNPYSERFAVNSERLQDMGIAAPKILDLYQLTDGSTAVLYQPLPGQTLRQVMQSMGSPAVRQALVERFGKFLAVLHGKGVYFRSLHLGNVLLMDDGEFALIDIADMHIYPSSLRIALRKRNLRHMQRYPEDRRWLFEEQLQALLDGYASLADPVAVNSLSQQIKVQAAT
ncbi:bifunctional O-antigen ligase/aminoglycoside phosphotransferase family protein [Pseudomonas psychrophila]|jgi:O-antigen ligase/tRNA A-37 threonylcarbamoyl transferase component Bud32|uniref:O-antigen ligase n=1 Tax=Pseudomonas psychrophila TaxID=122355 RepID=A0ABY0VD42_9PSED|nr:bifunctional O-antigen ligase/aminoglycoside phosphotransferase family protein [Pseudomonas psychrophila]KAB0487139.1 polymerase [Pseudomonas psychrophila]KMM97475.1 polymerase [Pseudomonas psychrophila]QIE30892.1 polymerase [Pseudomonas psychrophila]WVI97435.1 O-antigen ligase family protein [Pseudomonas psychrophila]SDU09600.1 O-antigen ligase [Pseudomonas psychrophila]